MAPTVRVPNKAIAWVSVLMLGLPLMATAQNVTNWATWVIPTEYPNASTVRGSFYATGTTGSVVDPVTGETTDLIVSGEVFERSRKNSTFWGGPAYTSSPISPTNVYGADRLAATGYTPDQYKAHNLAFSQPVTNAVMPIYSLGRSGQAGELTFSQPFVVLSSDNRFTTGGDATSGYKISGLEGNGLIQFLGTYDRISWVVTAPELFYAYSIGLTTPDNPLAGTAVPVYDIFGVGGVTAPTTFAVFAPEPDPPAEPEPEPQSVLERVLAQIEAATNLAPINGIYANVAENIGGANGAGVDGSITNIITGVTGISQQAVATAGDKATTIALPTLNFDAMTTTALGAVNTGEIVLGVNTNIDDATARTTRAVSSVMTQLGGADVSGAVVINIAANMTGIDGATSNTLTMVNGTIGDLSTTALGAVNTGTVISGVDAKVQGIVGLGE